MDVMHIISPRATRKIEKNMVALKSSLKKCLKFKSQLLGKKLYATVTKGDTILGKKKSEFLRYEREWLEDTAEMSSLKKFPDEPETSELRASEQESRRARLKKGGMKRIIKES